MSSEDEPSAQDLAASSRHAFTLILIKLGRRDHTEKELERALARKGCSEEATKAALGKARRLGLVNDVRLAGAIARINARSGKRGPLRIVATLRQKGIAEETARAATKQAFATSEEAESSVIRFATKSLERARGDTLKEKRLRGLRSLVSRGFELPEARRVLRLAENALMTENRTYDADAEE